MNTDLVNQLNITNLNGQLMGGSINLAGRVGWDEQVTWDLKGRADRLNPDNKILPQAVRDFLPPL